MNEMFEKLTETNDVEVKRSPLEVVLKIIIFLDFKLSSVFLVNNLNKKSKEHLIKNLQTHQNYTNQLNNHFESEVKIIKDETEEKIKNLKNPLSIQQAQIEENERIENLKIELDKQIQLITKHYDK